MSVAISIKTEFNINELNDALRELRLVQRELVEFEDHQRRIHQVDFAIETEDGQFICVREVVDGHAEFILQDRGSKKQIATVNNIKQAYARLKILNQAKRQGYKNVKEEKLKDGSVRLVLEKWR